MNNLTNTFSDDLPVFTKLKFSSVGIIKLTARLLSTLALALYMISPASAQSGKPAPQDDTQIWNDVQIAVPVNKQIDLNLFGTLRLGRDVTHAVDERAGFGFTFKGQKYFTFAPSYTYIATQPVAGRKGYESRLSMAVTARKQFEKLTVSDRNLFERRFLNSKPDTTRYRNRLQFEYPVSLGSLKLRLFASDEVFYDWGAKSWVRNRFSAGASKTFNKHFTFDLYYMRQNDGRSRPGDLHVLGTTYKIRL